VVQKLKSERVQLQLQVPAKEQRKVQATSGGRYAVGRDVILSFELITQEAVAPPGIVEAGPASGTPGHNHQPSTERKEVDHG
jgi:hypothetical protein